MRWVRVALGVFALAAAAALLTGALDRADAEPPAGPPLTKEQYGERYLELAQRTPKLNSYYYDLLFDDLPKRRCVTKMRRLQRTAANLAHAAGEVVPPREIAALHQRLVDAGVTAAASIGKASRAVASGRLECGDEDPGIPKNAGERINSIYYAGPIDGVTEKLYDLGYFLGGA